MFALKAYLTYWKIDQRNYIKLIASFDVLSEFARFCLDTHFLIRFS